MILEGLITTLDSDGMPHLSAMGAHVDRGLTNIQLRPFADSNTFDNLQQTGRGVFHVTDNVEYIARAAINLWDSPPSFARLPAFEGVALSDCCRWYAFHVQHIGPERPRVTVQCELVRTAHNREFFGLNRAMFAVVEAAILATRLPLFESCEVQKRINELLPLIEKTGGCREKRAFALITEHIEQYYCNAR